MVFIFEFLELITTLLNEGEPGACYIDWMLWHFIYTVNCVSFEKSEQIGMRSVCPVIGNLSLEHVISLQCCYLVFTPSMGDSISVIHTDMLKQWVCLALNAKMALPNPKSILFLHCLGCEWDLCSGTYSISSKFIRKFIWLVLIPQFHPLPSQKLWG